MRNSLGGTLTTLQPDGARAWLAWVDIGGATVMVRVTDDARQALELKQGQPVISVDTKKKELVGDFKNGGRELRPKGDPEPVRVHDFVIPELGRVTPYGVYDVGKNRGWVSVGVDHDTATFAVESIRRWSEIRCYLTALCRQGTYPHVQ